MNALKTRFFWNIKLIEFFDKHIHNVTWTVHVHFSGNLKYTANSPTTNYNNVAADKLLIDIKCRTKNS